MKNNTNSIISSLLTELSWSGKGINRYRDGGKGLENVLSAEVFQLLDFLPRAHFWGAIVKEIRINNSDLKDTLYKEIEDADLTFLPGNFYLVHNHKSHQDGQAVQPDAILTTPSVYCLVEAKRIKRTSFMQGQLSKEFYLVTRDAGNKQPILLLILGKEPPVNIESAGRRQIADEIGSGLREVHETANYHPFTVEEMQSLVSEHYGWITWDIIRRIVSQQLASFPAESDSHYKSIERLCNGIINAIERHS